MHGRAALVRQLDQEEVSLVLTWSKRCDPLVNCFFASEDMLKQLD